MHFSFSHEIRDREGRKNLRRKDQKAHKIGREAKSPGVHVAEDGPGTVLGVGKALLCLALAMWLYSVRRTHLP